MAHQCLTCQDFIIYFKNANGYFLTCCLAPKTPATPSFLLVRSL
ncbi:hypothetical protein [Moraxella lacunata]